MAIWVECLQYNHVCVFICDYESFYVYEMCSRHGKSVFVFVSGLCLLPLSIRARRQKLFSGELVQFSMKMRFAGPCVPALLC